MIHGREEPLDPLSRIDLLYYWTTVPKRLHFTAVMITDSPVTRQTVLPTKYPVPVMVSVTVPDPLVKLVGDIDVVATAVGKWKILINLTIHVHLVNHDLFICIFCFSVYLFINLFICYLVFF